MARISLGRHRAALEAAFRIERAELRGAVERGLVAIDVQDAAGLVIEVDALAPGDVEQIVPRLNSEAGGLDGVGAIVRDVAEELRHPRIFVPGRHRVHQQRRIGLEHPFDALQHGRPGVPHFGIAGGELAAIGERGLHRRIALAVDHGDRIALVGQGIGGGDAGDAGADDGDVGAAPVLKLETVWSMALSRRIEGHGPDHSVRSGCPQICRGT